MNFDEATKVYSEYQAKYKDSLTPEQREIEKQMAEVRRTYLDPIWSEKRKTQEQEKLEKYRKENPVIKFVPGGSNSDNVNTSSGSDDSSAAAPAITPTLGKPKPEKAPEKSSSPDPAPSQASTSPVTSDPKPTLQQEDSLLLLQKRSFRSHFMLPLVTKALKARCHVWLVGPAGSGKSSIASDAAAELNLPYASLSVCGQTTKTDLLGYSDASGKYRTTCFREAYEKGGIFCLDEVDNGNANVLAVINSALSNNVCTFPDKTINRHPDFLVVACANTFGLGAHGGYVGRTPIDAATLDRFFFIEIPYDEGLEMYIAGISDVSSPVWDAGEKYVPTTEEWIKLVKTIRARVAELNAKAIISPRATSMGTSLIKQNVPMQFLQKGLLYKGMSADLLSKLRQ